jgi:hypothetical protein
MLWSPIKFDSPVFFANCLTRHQPVEKSFTLSFHLGDKLVQKHPALLALLYQGNSSSLLLFR